MYSTYDPEFLLETIVEKLKDIDSKLNVNANKWKLQFDVVREAAVPNDTESDIREGGYVRMQLKIKEFDK